MARLGRIALILAAFLSSIPAQSPAIEWFRDLGAAKKQASAENKPLFIAFVMDDEPANDEVCRHHFHDSELVDMSRKFVCLIANIGRHDGGDGKARSDAAASPCPKFGCVSCSDHQQVEQDVKAAFFDSPRVSAPQFLIVSVDGKTILLRHVYTLPAAELVKKMRIGLALADPAKASDEIERLRAATCEQIRLANDSNAETRRSAILALASSDDPMVLEFLTSQTAPDVDGPKRLEAIEAMGSSGKASTLAVLEGLLKEKSSQVRLAVARAIERIRMPESAVPLMRALAKEDKDVVRAALAQALVACDPVTPAHRRAVLDMIRKGSQSDRMSGLLAVVRLRIDPELEKTLLAAARDKSAQVRGVAYWAIGRFDLKDAAGKIERGVRQEKSADVRNIGLLTLAGLRGDAYDGPDGDTLLGAVLSSAGVVNPSSSDD